MKADRTMGKIFRYAPAGAILLLAAGLTVAQEVVRLQRPDREVMSLAAYTPRTAACSGIALVSPGAGGSERGYRYLGEALSSLGYLTVVMGHQESGRRALQEHVRGNGLREGLAELITEPGAYQGRFMDIAASREWAEGQCHANNVILIGHSMGAATVMIEAGARNKVGIRGSDSFTAYVALSPQGAGSIFPDNAWSDIAKPVLLLTGTRDNELGSASWKTRTEPFKNFPSGCKWLGVIDGATHMNFAGNGLSRKTETLTAQTIAAFLDGLHRGDCASPRKLPGIDIDKK